MALRLKSEWKESGFSQTRQVKIENFRSLVTTIRLFNIVNVGLILYPFSQIGQNRYFNFQVLKFQVAILPFYLFLSFQSLNMTNGIKTGLTTLSNLTVRYICWPLHFLTALKKYFSENHEGDCMKRSAKKGSAPLAQLLPPRSWRAGTHKSLGNSRGE